MDPTLKVSSGGDTEGIDEEDEDFFASKQQAVLDCLREKFGSDKSKDEIIKALEACPFLHRIPLPPSTVPLEQAQKDFRRERVLLNDVAFVPDKVDVDRCHAFALTLQVLVERLIRNSRVYDLEKFENAEKICDLIMQRACRTSAGADSFFSVQKLLCAEATFITQKTQDDDPPVFIDVFLADHYDDKQANHRWSHGRSSTKAEIPQLDLCVRIQISNCFAIFDVESVDEITGNEKQDPKPWLDVETVVIDESNFREGRHWRRLHLIVTNPETGVTYSSTDELSSIQKASGRISGRKVLKEFGSWLSSSTAVLGGGKVTESSQSCKSPPAAQIIAEEEEV